MFTTKQRFDRRVRRTRSALRKKSRGRLRLSVFRSGRHIYAQVIDDTKGAFSVDFTTVHTCNHDNYFDVQVFLFLF
jgi:large subunit ribosomal protein L18